MKISNAKIILSLVVLLALAGGVVAWVFISGSDEQKSSNEAQDKTGYQEKNEPKQANQQKEAENKEGKDFSMPNPASENCLEKGGELKMEMIEGRGTVGVCHFGRNKQCEEWAMYNGHCPVGGVDISSFENEEQIYCAIRGGEVNKEENLCQARGKSCKLSEYYTGECLLFK